MKSHNKFLVLTLTALIALSTVACSNKKKLRGHLRLLHPQNLLSLPKKPR